MSNAPCCQCVDEECVESKTLPSGGRFNDGLPDPEERPGVNVVIYDGSCRFCRESAKSLNRLDTRRRLSFIPLQDVRVAKWYPDLPKAELDRHIHVVAPDGRRRRGARAVRYLTRKLPLLWPLAPALHIPGSMPIWQWFYMRISERRHLLDR